MAQGGTRPAPLRRDAQRNRDALIAAALDVFAELGPDAPLDVIARRAGVGNATLYRHFPTRDALIGEVFADAARVVVDAGRDALAVEDAWSAIEGYFTRIFDLVAHNRGINDVVTMAIPSVPALAEMSHRNAETVGELVARAQRQGTMRTDVVAMDLLFLLGPLCRAVPAAHDLRPGLWRRYLALLLDGFRAPAGPPLPEPPVGEERLDELFAGLWEAGEERPGG
ncbi:helix-turn-helix domain-containing protein [Kitasatospora paracochleata]|uniref:AcrR family transcriptional regulator n=1 Tax=Kitasatospora paracochleata TaxID=58354 RepID=A0ABT1J3S4_9ACTN|nr:TetR/AcrR family transcriptional regulator [Kitasatospora paracochleata]MCP2312095.1 AcrR family transcriptional regulator [Kitasatospora paracochleata]